MIAQISLVLALPGGALLLRNIWPLPVMKHSQERPPVWPEPVEAPLELPWVAVPLKASVMVLCWLVASAVAIEAWYRMHESTAGSKVVHWKINRQPAISGVKEQPISVAVRKAYRYSDALALDWKSGENLKWSFTWLDFDKGAQSSFTFNIHRPEVCLPSAGFTFAKLFPPLELNIGGQPLSFEHHIYERQGQLLNLFTVTIRDIPSLGDTVRNDWSVDGRLNAAMGGLRSRRSELIHLVVEGASDPRQIRAAATAYLKQIINYE